MPPMPNTFDAVPEAAHERSSAFLAVDKPQNRLEQVMDEAGLHRGSLREQDGYTIPFREGGVLRIRVVEGDDQGRTGLEFTADGPTVERLEHIKQVAGEEVGASLGESRSLTWEPID